MFPLFLRQSLAQVVRPESLDPDLFGALLDDRPDWPGAHTRFDLAAFGNGPKQLSILDSSGDLPGVDAVLDPEGDGDGH